MILDEVLISKCVGKSGSMSEGLVTLMYSRLLYCTPYSHAEMSGEVQRLRTHKITFDTKLRKSTVYKNKYHNKLQLYLLIIFCPCVHFK